MSVSDGKSLTYEEQIALFAEKEAALAVIDKLLLFWGEHPNDVHDQIRQFIVDLKNSDGSASNMPESIWDSITPYFIPALEQVAARVQEKLIAPQN